MTNISFVNFQKIIVVLVGYMTDLIVNVFPNKYGLAITCLMFIFVTVLCAWCNSVLQVIDSTNPVLMVIFLVESSEF